jgi:uncharacterized protein YdgA (DUF945 family)
MKKFRIVLIVAVAALLALPPVFGLVTQSQVRARVQSLNANETLSATIESYDRGWFTSTARISVAPPAAALGGGTGTSGVGGAAATPDGDVEPDLLALLFDRPLDVVVDFSHGPVSIRDGFFLGASEFVARPAPESGAARSAAPPAAPGDAAYEFEFRGQTTFSGELHFLAVLPPFDRDADFGAVGFSGGRMSGTVAGRRITARGEAATLQLTSGPGTLSLQGLSASADNELLSRYLMPGAFELGIERASVDVGLGGLGAGAPLFDAAGIVFSTNVRLDPAANLLDSSAALRLDSARFGADTRITGGRLDVAAQRLDAAALEAASRTVDAAGEAGANLDDLAPFIARMLDARPALTVNPLRFDVNGAPFEATLSAETSPAALPATGSVDFRSLELWGAVLRGHAVVTAEKRLVERMATAAVKSQLAAQFMEGSAVPFEALDTMAEAQAGLVLAMLAVQGFIEDTGNVYKTELRLEGGMLTVNGRPLPLGLL